MSEAVYDMEAYVKLDDSVFNRILYNNEDNDENMVEAKRILTKIMKRELYKFVGEVQLLDDDLNMEKLKKQIAEACPDLQDMFQKNLIVEEALFDYGMKDKNPVDHVFFYRKSAPDVPVKIEKHEVSQMLPGVFIEKFLRVYWKKRDDTFGKIKDCFSEWKTDHMSKRNKHGS